MKLWLLEILACPIDHAFPLECTIFKWENEDEGKEDKIQQLLAGYKKGLVLPPKIESPIVCETRDDGFYVHDFLVLKPTTIQKYLETLTEKIEELKVVHDKSHWAGEQALKLIMSEIKEKIKEMLATLQTSTKTSINTSVSPSQSPLNAIMPQLEFLNLFKYHLDIEDAVILCPECGRWFPVFETIPQMLPDEVRNSEQDQAFREKWVAVFPPLK